MKICGCEMSQCAEGETHDHKCDVCKEDLPLEEVCTVCGMAPVTLTAKYTELNYSRLDSSLYASGTLDVTASATAS